MKRITFLLACLICLTACNNEFNGSPDVISGEDDTRIGLLMPDAEMVSVYSTATVSENTIDTVWVLVFDGTSLTKKWIEKIEGSKIFKNGDASQLLPQLKHKPTPGDSIICIANINPVTDTTSVTISNINAHFRLDPTHKTYYTGSDHLPMSGGFRWATTSGNVCEMVRAVAKIQIRMGTSVSDFSANFSAENVSYQIYHHAAGGYIIPTSPISGQPNSLGAHTSDVFRLLQKNVATQNELSVYLYEYASSSYTGLNSTTPISSNSAFNSDRQHIILTKMNGATPYFYRLDLYDFATDTYFDTKRNHHYLFTINKVRSEGYDRLEEAQKYPGSNIEYTLTIDDGAKEVASNGQYAIVATLTPSRILIDNSTGTYTAGNVRHLLPTGLPDPVVNSISWEVTSSNVPIATATSRITLTSPSPSVMTSTNQPINIQVAQSSPIITAAKGTLTFKLGNITYQKEIEFSNVP